MSRKTLVAALLTSACFTFPLFPVAQTADPAKSEAPKKGLVALLPTDSVIKHRLTAGGQSIAYIKGGVNAQTHPV